VTVDLVVEVMRSVESLLTYFARAQDVEAKVTYCGQHFSAVNFA